MAYWLFHCLRRSYQVSREAHCHEDHGEAYEKAHENAR